MLTKTKLALVAALIAGSASAAFAQEGGWSNVNRYGDNGTVTNHGRFQSAPVALDRGGAPAQDFYFAPQERSGSRAYPGDRAGHLVDGGGN